MINDRLKQLAGVYLLRTRDELQALNDIVPAARQGNPESLLNMRNTAHGICGSGAMLGFKTISDAAAQIERILRRADPVPTDAEWGVIVEQLQRLQTELDQQPNATDDDT